MSIKPEHQRAMRERRSAAAKAAMPEVVKRYAAARALPVGDAREAALLALAGAADPAFHQALIAVMLAELISAPAWPAE